MDYFTQNSPGYTAEGMNFLISNICPLNNTRIKLMKNYSYLHTEQLYISILEGDTKL